MKKLFMTFILLLAGFSFAYEGPVDLKDVNKWKLTFEKAVKTNDEKFTENFEKFMNHLIQNNYKPQTKKDKAELLGFISFAVSLAKHKIDNNTRLDSVYYDDKTDTLIYKKTIHDINGVAKYNFITSAKNNKELLKRLRLTAKTIMYNSAMKFCNKSPKAPFGYSLLNSGTKIKEVAYYEYPNGKKVNIGINEFDKNICNQINKEKSPEIWFAKQPEVKILIKYMNNK